MRYSTPAARIVLIMGLTLIYAFCFVAIKAGLAYAPPLLFAGLRVLIGGVVLFILTFILRQPLLPPRRDWSGIVALALTATTLAFGAMFLSPGRTGAGIASVLGNTQPLMVVVLAALFLGERMTASKWATLAFGFMGVSLIAGRALVGPDAYGIAGAMLALAASLGAGIGNIIFKRLAIKGNLLVITAWQLVLGSLPLLLLAALFEQDGRVIWNAEFVGLLLFLALVGTSLANAVWYWLLQREEVGRLTMFLFLVPVLGLGIAALTFGERISLLEGIGSVLTVIGVGIVELSNARNQPAAQTA